MPVINGKRRYLPEKEAPEKQIIKRYAPPAQPAKPKAAKRYVKGRGPHITSVISQESTRKFINAYEFEVWIGLIPVNFSKLTNMGNEIDIDVFSEGGYNDHPVIRQKSNQMVNILFMEKGVTDTAGGKFFSLLRQGMKLTSILIFVRHNGDLMKIFSIDEGLIMSKRYSDLDATQSAILIESLELAHTGLKEILVPW